MLKSVPVASLSIILANLIAHKLPAIAQPAPATIDPLTTTASAFVPPSNPERRSGGNDTTGARQDSCIENDETPFALLSPVDTVGYSASPQPTVSWHLPESEVQYPVKLRFFLSDLDGKREVKEVDIDYSPGITTYSLPVEIATLTPGIEYGWQVVVECNENRPSQSLFQTAWFEIEEPSLELQQAVEAAATEAERALAYGQAGFWYDAIAQVAQSSDPAAIAVRHHLLQDLAAYLADEEAASEAFKAGSETPSGRLLEIIQADAQPTP